MFLLPLAGVSEGQSALTRLGLPEGFLARVRDRVTTGTRALFLLTDGAAIDRIRRALPDADLLVSVLGREHEAALGRAFDAGTGDAGPLTR